MRRDEAELSADRGQGFEPNLQQLDICWGVGVGNDKDAHWVSSGENSAWLSANGLSGDFYINRNCRFCHYFFTLLTFGVGRAEIR